MSKQYQITNKSKLIIGLAVGLSLSLSGLYLISHPSKLMPIVDDIQQSKVLGSEPILYYDNSHVQPIDSNYVNTFISDVNTERAKSGLNPLQHTSDLDSMAQLRFNTMVSHYEINHYGYSGSLGAAEGIYFPDGITAQDLTTKIEYTDTLHWQQFDSPFAYYGYYIGKGPIIDIDSSCAYVAPPGVSNEIQDLNNMGCKYTVTNGTWLVFETEAN